MSATYYEEDGVKVCLSDAGYNALADEQRHAHAEILMWTTAASCIAIAGLVLKQILGA